MKATLLTLILLFAITPKLIAQIHFGGYFSPVRAHLADPVLIRIGGQDAGSGFYLRTTNNWWVLATAKHVLFDETGKLRGTNMVLVSHTYAPTNTGDCEVTVNFDQFFANGLVRTGSVHDVAAIKLGKVRAQTAQPEVLDFNANWLRVVSTNGGGPLLVGESTLRPFARAKVGDDVFVFGYPSSIGIKQSPKFDYSKPLLRKGIIAGLYEKQQTLIVDAPVYFGNSGGPVLEVEQVEFTTFQFGIVGVVTQIIPFADVWENRRFNYSTAQLSNSGYSVVEPIDFILELVRN